MVPVLGERRYDVTRAVVMSLGGSVAAFVPGAVLMVGMLFLSSLIPDGAFAAALAPAAIAPLFLCPGLWSGWRLGRWGYAVGAISSVVVFAKVSLTSPSGDFLPRSTSEVLLWAAAAAVAAVGGRLGQARFQKVKARNDAEIRKAMHLPEPAG